MAYVKITGYLEVSDHELSGDRYVITQSGYEGLLTVPVGELEDIRIGEDDRADASTQS